MKIKKVKNAVGLVGQVINDLTIESEKDSLSINAVKILLDSKLDQIHPIGSIYMTVDQTNPSTLFGGTWEAWGSGRVPVGVDVTQTEFNSVEKIGGSMDMQNHFHNGLFVDGTPLKFAGGGNQSAGNAFQGIQLNGPNMIYTASTGTGNSGNLQPYITCYMWKRTA